MEASGFIPVLRSQRPTPHHPTPFLLITNALLSLFNAAISSSYSFLHVYFYRFHIDKRCQHRCSWKCLSIALIFVSVVLTAMLAYFAGKNFWLKTSDIVIMPTQLMKNTQAHSHTHTHTHTHTSVRKYSFSVYISANYKQAITRQIHQGVCITLALNGVNLHTHTHTSAS